MQLKFAAMLVALLPALAALPVCAANTFKCKDAKGIWHYGDKLPPECAKLPTQKLDASGVKRSEDPGELTAEQRAELDAKEKQKEREQKRISECQRANKALLITYNSAEEIDAARAKTLRQAEENIRGIQQRITDTQQLQVKLQKEADGYKGKKVPADLKESIDTAEKDLRNNQQLVVSRRKELDGIRGKFDEEKRRYLELTGPHGAEAAACDKAAAAGK